MHVHNHVEYMNVVMEVDSNPIRKIINHVKSNIDESHVEPRVESHVDPHVEANFETSFPTSGEPRANLPTKPIDEQTIDTPVFIHIWIAS